MEEEVREGEGEGERGREGEGEGERGRVCLCVCVYTNSCVENTFLSTVMLPAGQLWYYMLAEDMKEIYITQGGGGGGGGGGWPCLYACRPGEPSVCVWRCSGEVLLHLGGGGGEADALLPQRLDGGPDEAQLGVLLEALCPLHHQGLQLLTHLGVGLRSTMRSGNISHVHSLKLTTSVSFG